MTASGNLIYQETTTTGTGNLTLTAKTGFRAFSDEFAISASFWYCVRDQTTGAFEVGTGHLSSSTVLVRDSVIQSSNSNALVNFAAGIKDVICDVPASIQNTITAKVPYTGATDNVDLGAFNLSARYLYLTNDYSFIALRSGAAFNSFIYGNAFATGDQTFELPDFGGTIAITSTPLADCLAAFDNSGQTILALDTATYPNFTELSYLKGATSDIQQQIDDLTDAVETQGVGSNIGGALADQDYIVAIKMPFAGTITETTTKCASGTATATFKINTTALGGTVNIVSTSEQSQAHATDNFFSAGDDIIITISSNAACTDMSFMIKYLKQI